MGARGNPLTETMVAIVQQRYIPNRVVVVIEPSQQDGGAALPLANGKSSLNGRPTAYICQHQTCSHPVTEPRQLEALL